MVNDNIKKKKILIVHNKYRNIGGEDIAVENEIEFLKTFNDVKVIFFENKINQIFKQVISFLKNSNNESTNYFINEYNSFNPDIVYIHNLWFKASLGILKFLKKQNIKVFVKFHNFRYDCTSSFFKFKHLNGSKFCEACGFDNTNTIILNKYFKDSYLKSILIILFSKKYIKLLEASNFQILLLTQFHMEYIESKNYKFKNLNIFPNYLEVNHNEKSKEDFILYAGRISIEKGIKELIEAFIDVKYEKKELYIIGDGPDLKSLKNKYKDFEDIRFFGVIENNKVHDLISKSRGVVTATKLYEGQPTLLCEASLMSIPSIFPKSGGIEEFFPTNYSLSYSQFDYSQLSKKIKEIYSIDDISSVGLKNQKFIMKKLNQNDLRKKFNEIYEQSK